jgi:ribonuclease HI
MSISWRLYFDGSKRVASAGAGVVLTCTKGDKMQHVLSMNFHNASNNEAEYEALLYGMHMSKECGATHLMIYGVSNLVVQQPMK